MQRPEQSSDQKNVPQKNLLPVSKKKEDESLKNMPDLTSSWL